MLTINIYYTGVNGSAKKFVEEMITSGLVDKIRSEKGNISYEYFYSVSDEETVLLKDVWENVEDLDSHHKGELMESIAKLREKYQLKMKVMQYKNREEYNEDFETVIRKRTATRKFKNKEVPKHLIDKILEAGRLAPTAKNLQPQKILVVTSKEGLKLIDEVSPCRYNAPCVMVVCSDKSKAFIKEDSSTYIVDASIVATHMMLEATNVGIDNIWIEMFDKKKLKEVFQLDKDIFPICLLPMGYKSDDYLGNPNHLIRKNIKEMVEYK